MGPECSRFYHYLLLEFSIQVELPPSVTVKTFTGVTTNFFPSSELQNSPKGNIFEVIGVPSPTEVRINVGVSSIHIYDEGGQLLVGITTNIFPDGTQGNLFPVVAIDSTNELRVNVGTSTIPHNYVSGGLVFTGITTNIFPSPETKFTQGNIFEVIGKMRCALIASRSTPASLLSPRIC